MHQFFCGPLIHICKKVVNTLKSNRVNDEVDHEEFTFLVKLVLWPSQK